MRPIRPLEPDGRGYADEPAVNAGRRPLEERLRETEERFDALAAVAPVAMFIYQGEQLVYLNPAAASITGYSYEELAGMRFYDFIHPDDRAMVRERGMARQGGADIPRRYEVRIIDKAGETRWIDFSAGRIEYDGLPGVIGVAVDISERRRAEEESRRAFEEFRLAFENAKDAIFWADADTGILINCNASAERLLERPRGEIIGRHQSELHPGAPDPENRNYTAVFRRHVRDHGAQDDEAFVAAPDGRLKPVTITASVSEVGGRRIVQGIFRDMSERRRLEEELFRAKKLESLGTLTGGIAHDFNNVLTSIMGNLTLARLRLGREEPALDPIGRAERAAQRARDIVRQLLTFARGEPPRREIRDLRPIVREALDMLPAAAREKCRLSLPDLPAEAPVDRTRLLQALSNLLVNADQATRPAGRIGISLEAVTLVPDNPWRLRSGDYLRLAVADDGRGLDPDTLDRIFDPYYTTKPFGSGLGLAIAHSIARDHEGTLSAEPAASGGAVFQLILPRRLRAVPPERPAPAAREGADAAVPRAPGGNGRGTDRPGPLALVAHANAPVAEILADMLGDLGYRVRIVPARREAIAQACAGEPAAALVLDAPSLDALDADPAPEPPRPGRILLIGDGEASAPGGDDRLIRLRMPCRFEDLERALPM